MRSGLKIGLVAAVVAAQAALLWPFMNWFSFIPAALLLTAILLAMNSSRVPGGSTTKWQEYALRCMFTGAALGGIGLFAIVRLTGYGAIEGWEGVIAIVYGMMGAVLGAVTGAIAGGIFGRLRNRRAS